MSLAIVFWPDHVLRNANKQIDKAIDSAIKSQRSLIEWVLGYEVTEATLPSARSEIYWIVKDAAQKARSKTSYRSVLNLIFQFSTYSFNLHQQLVPRISV